VAFALQVLGEAGVAALLDQKLAEA
jgi:hypothetical protein